MTNEEDNYYDYAYVLSLFLMGKKTLLIRFSLFLSPLLCFHSCVLIPAFLYNILFFFLPESLCRSIHRASAPP